MREVAPTVAAGANRVHVICLGCGGSGKDRWWLEELRDAASGTLALRVTAIDASPDLALQSAGRLRDLAFVVPVVADLMAFDDFRNGFGKGEPSPDEEDGPRIFTCFGLLPNFEPDVFLPKLRSWLRENEVVLLSANLMPADEDPDAAMRRILPQYDNPEARSWLLRFASDWGWENDLDFSTYVMRVESQGALRRFVATIRWARDAELNLGGTDTKLRVRESEPLRLFFSYRYTPESLAATLQKHGLVLGHGHISSSGEEGVFACGLSSKWQRG
jgi:hypothetical protein